MGPGRIAMIAYPIQERAIRDPRDFDVDFITCDDIVKGQDALQIKPGFLALASLLVALRGQAS
jgi:hypothetical protein